MYDVQEIRKEPGQTYVIQCKRSRTHIGECGIKDMFGTFSALKAEQAIRIGVSAINFDEELQKLYTNAKYTRRQK